MDALVTPLPHGWQKRINMLIVLLAILSMICFILSALYFDLHPILWSFPYEGAFWENRMDGRMMREFLLGNGVLMLALMALFIGVLHPSAGAAWRRLRNWFAADAGRGRSLYYVLVATTALIYTPLRFIMSHEFKRASLTLLTEGEAIAPFQYRVLVPWLVKAFSMLGLPVAPLYVVVEALALVCLVVIFERLLRHFFSNEWTSRLLSLTILLPLLSLLASPHRPNNVYYPWDTPSIAFFVLGLLLIYRRQWIPYYVLFVVATFNRETTCFLTMIYFITALLGQERYRVIIQHCAAQFVIWIAIKFLMLQIYPGLELHTGDGSLFEDQIFRNLVFFSNPLSYLFFLKVMAGIWLPLLIMACWVPHVFVRRALLVLLPFMVGMYMVGLLVEIRIYGEMIPLVLTAFLLILRRIVFTVQYEQAEAALTTA